MIESGGAAAYFHYQSLFTHGDTDPASDSPAPHDPPPPTAGGTAMSSAATGGSETRVVMWV